MSLSQIFISQNPNFTIEWGGDEKQAQWAKLFLLALQRCDAWLAQEINVKSLQDIYYFLSYERVKIARVLGHKIAYGIPRVTDSIQSPFSPNRLRTKTQYTEIKEKFLSLPKNTFGEVDYKISLNGQEKIALTLSFDQETETLFVGYPSIKVAKQLMQEANIIWQNLFAHQNEYSITDKYFQLGKILWHLAIARPLEFGGASVGEALYYILTKQLGMPLIAIDCGNKTWDIWAMYHDSPDKFASWFSQTAMMTLQSIDVNTHATLPALDIIDHTAAIEAEAKMIYSQGKKSENTSSYQTTQLVDPYGLGLFHHYNLIFFKIEFESLNHSVPNTIFSPYGKKMEIAYKIMSNGQVLFLDALQNVPNNIDPVIFKMNIMDSFSKEKLESIKEETDKITILKQIQENIFNDYDSTPDEIKRKWLVSYFNYFVSLFDNTEIKQLAKDIAALIQAAPEDSDLLEVLESNNEKIIRLYNLVDNEKSYTNFQLMKLIEISDCADIMECFKDIELEGWLLTTMNGKSFFDQILETKNKNLITHLLKVVAPDQLEALMNRAAEKNNPEQITFLFFHLLENFSTFSIDILDKYVKPWMKQRPDINLISLIFDHPILSVIPLEKFIPILFSSLSSEIIKEVRIADILKIKEIDNKVIAVEFFTKRGMSLTLPDFIGKELIENIRSYVYFSKDIDVCRQLLKQIPPKMIQNLFMIHEKHLTMYFADNKNSIINFCNVLNEMANAVTENSLALFAPKSQKKALQQAVFNGMQGYIRQDSMIRLNVLKIYFKRFDFLSEKHLQKLKSLLIKNKSQYIEREFEKIMTIIDNKIKTFVPKLSAK